jgi:predicted ATPase/DNA-binding SARP family transcriptional activator
MVDKRSNTAQAQVHVYFLRPFRIEQKGNIVHLPTRKTESLLAYLVLHPNSHSREKLATLLWADSSDVSARGSLRKALNFIRKHLGNEIILSDRDQVQLNPDFDLYCDAVEFERQASPLLAVQNQNIHEMDFEFYKNELLTDFYEDWILEEREHYHQLYIKVLLRAIEVLRAQSEYSTAIQYAKKLLIHDSTNEPAYQHLIFCHIASGDRYEAVQQYETCRKVLETELGVKPARETRALYEWITQSSTEVESLAARLTNLPIPISSFIGRGRELAEIKRLLSTARLITLTGVGGSGKTRLAIRVATELLDSFHNGVWWVDFSSLSSAALVPQSVAKCLGVIESPEQALIEAIIAAIQEKEMLLVLDNCEHLVETCAQLANRLLTECPHLKIFTTSREALRVDGEVVFSVPTLLVPKIDRISIAELLLDYESVKLFVARARAVQNSFVVDDHTAVFIAQICARLDGIPLAIELAAARVKTMSVGQITANLNDVFGLLIGRSRTALPRQQTLRALIDWSYDLLSGDEQEVLRCLSVFAGGWTLEAGEAVSNNWTMLDLLSHLVDKSLVAVDFEHDNEPRFFLLETIRQYAREKLSESGEAKSIRDRHLAYFLSLAVRAEPEVHGAEQLLWFDRLEAELDNFRTALEWSLEGGERGAQLGLQMASSLWWFWFLRNHHEESRWLEKTLEVSRNSTDLVTRANALVRLAWVRFFDESHADEGLTLGRTLGPAGRESVALALLGKGAWAMYQADYARAKSLAEESSKLFREIRNRWGLCEALTWMGLSLIFHGEYRQAISPLEESLTLARQANDGDEIGFALWQLGKAAMGQKEYARATVLMEESLALYKELKLYVGITFLLGDLGKVSLAQNDYQRAASHYREALTIHWDRGNKRFIAEDLERLADVAIMLQQSERAARLLGAAEALRQSTGADLFPYQLEDYERDLEILRSQLDETALRIHWVEGRAMDVKQAVEYALTGQSK